MDNLFTGKKYSGLDLGCVLILISLIVIFEGVVRKWISSGLGLSLIAVQDLLVVFVVFRVFLSNVRLGDIRGVLLIYSLFIFLVSLSQAVIYEHPIIVVASALRFWVLYPVFFILCGLSITREQFYRLLYFFIYSGVVLVPLVVFQYLSPPDAFINKQVGESEYIFLLVDGVVRTTGTFSFTMGMSSFSIILTTISLTLFVMQRGGVGGKTVLLAMISSAVLALLSGSRAAVLFFGFSIAVSFFFTMINSSGYRSFYYLVVSIVVTGLLLLILSYSDLGSNLLARFSAASESESYLYRISDMLLGVSVGFDDVWALGYGIGSGSNLTARALDVQGFALAESEPARIVLEAGVLGVAVLIFKYFVCLRLLLTGLSDVFFYREPAVLVLCLGVVVVLVSWPISGQLTVSSLAALFGIIVFGFIRFRRSDFG